MTVTKNVWNYVILHIRYKLAATFIVQRIIQYIWAYFSMLISCLPLCCFIHVSGCALSDRLDTGVFTQYSNSLPNIIQNELKSA